MKITLSYKNDAHRKLCIKKDLIELSQWIDTIENINAEFDHLKLIEKQLIQNNTIRIHLQGLRRKNTLVMGSFCQYEQELRKEFIYGKQEYDLARAKEHEKRRDHYSVLIHEFRKLKRIIYENLSKYHRR
ncbi:hypothetical protein ACH3O9_14315 [Leeuwenhoekiella sp. A16]|uniref:hypothetical protein n=1 Tax=unclassified Leeuwenhoekiella TaxID=2615029 RepID=UPI003A8094F7